MLALGVMGPKLVTRPSRGERAGDGHDRRDQRHGRGAARTERENQDEPGDEQADEFAEAYLGVAQARGRVAAMAHGEAVDVVQFLGDRPDPLDVAERQVVGVGVVRDGGVAHATVGAELADARRVERADNVGDGADVGDLGERGGDGAAPIGQRAGVGSHHDGVGVAGGRRKALIEQRVGGIGIGAGQGEGVPEVGAGSLAKRR